MRGFVVLGALLAALAVAASAGAAVKPQTIKLFEIDRSFSGTGGWNPAANQIPVAGQGFVVEGDVYRWRGATRGARVGTLQAMCTFTRVDLDRNVLHSLCTAVISLPDGQIAVAGRLPGFERFIVPIVGGSGAYAGAGGYLFNKAIGGEESNKAAIKLVITG